jgi:hypothetical protein
MFSNILEEYIVSILRYPHNKHLPDSMASILENGILYSHYHENLRS